MGNLDNALQALEGLENGQELKELVLGAVDAEKQKGIAIKNKVAEEAISNRKFKILAEELGFNREEHDIDSFKSSLTEKLKLASLAEENTSKLSETELRFRNAEKTLAELNEKYEEEARKRQEAEDRNRKSYIGNKLTEVLQDKLPSYDLHVEKLVEKGYAKLAEDGKNVYINIDGEDLDFQSGIEKYLDQPNVKKYLLTPQRSGSGQGNSTGTNNTGEETTQDRINRVRKYGKVSF